MIKVAFAVGTRPEVIKTAPVIHAVARFPGMRPYLILTGQHREMVDQLLGHFGLLADDDLNVMRPGQTLDELTARTLPLMCAALKKAQADVLVVQGDTTTAFAASLAAFYSGVPVVHLEAGLRTRNLASPFPEEGNRALIGRLASLHLAPTPSAALNLTFEGVPRKDIVVTGNTVIDALLDTVRREAVAGAVDRSNGSDGRRMLLVTAHRRESWGEPMERIAQAILRLVSAFEDLSVVLPLHRNPVVRASLELTLQGHPRIALIEPVEYPAFVRLMGNADVILTDSGGVQEEAPSLGRPVLVMRDTTERPEGIAAGTAILVGTDPAVIYDRVSELLTDADAYGAMAQAASPYGDGRAAERVVAAIADMFDLGDRVPEFVPACFKGELQVASGGHLKVPTACV